MLIKSARIKSYRSWAIDESIISDTAKQRLEKIRLYETLKQEGCSSETALLAIKTKRSTLYLWRKNYKENGLKGLNPKSTRPKRLRKNQWTQSIRVLIFKLRKKHPCYGKEKIHRLMVRDYQVTSVSVSTVGRILQYFISLNKLKKAPSACRRRKPKNFTGHAQRIKKGVKAINPGEYLQIDHMSVSEHGETIKDFRAVCPVTKIMITRVYSRATSKTATLFLEEVIKDLPFAIKSIQVDGGSEFMKDFENFCEHMKIPLHVLPPRSPEMNGCVERANGTARDEFYAQYRGIFKLEAIRNALTIFQDQYNGYRPHQTLAYLTPFEYTKEVFKIEAA